MILCLSVLSVVISPFSFLILLIWFFSLCFLMSLANGLSILFILSENQLLVLLIFAMVSFLSSAFISALIFKISFLLLTVGFPISSLLVTLGVELGYLFDFFLISLDGMMLKLKIQYFGHLMQRVDSLEKTLMLGRIGGSRRRGRQRMRWLDGITDWMESVN